MKKDFFDLSGRVAVITGAGGGLGQVMAAGLAQYGTDVVCTDADVEGAAKAAKLVKAQGPEALEIECNAANQKKGTRYEGRFI